MFSRPPRAPRGKRKEQSTRLLFALRSLPIGNAETRPLGRVHATSRLSAGAPSLTVGFPHSQHGRAKFTSLLALCSLLLALCALPFIARAEAAPDSSLITHNSSLRNYSSRFSWLGN